MEKKQCSERCDWPNCTLDGCVVTAMENKTLQEFEEAIKDSGQKKLTVNGMEVYFHYPTIAKACYDIHELALAEQQTQMNEVAEEMAKERAIDFRDWYINLSESDLNHHVGNMSFPKNSKELYSEFIKHQQSKDK